MTGWMRVLAGAVVVAAACLDGADPARASQCAAGAVSARGEPSQFQWLAVTKAKGNWRAKVRRLKSLGGAYANWNRAESRAQHCGPDGKGIACTVTAIPCKP